MNETQQARNILNFPAKTALFNQELKGQIKTGLITVNNVDPQQAEQMVNTTEQVICAHIVAWARDVGTRIGTAIGEYFTK